jgi:hypothetical protein
MLPRRAFIALATSAGAALLTIGTAGLLFLASGQPTMPDTHTALVESNVLESGKVFGQDSPLTPGALALILVSGCVLLRGRRQ